MSRGNLRIAVVDDEDHIRKALARLLRSAGMDVATFASGPDFLEAVATHPLDCLVLDLQMPAMNGIEVRETLVRLGIALPVVIITGHDQPESRASALDAGVSAYLLKPVEAGVLLAAIFAAVVK